MKNARQMVMMFSLMMTLTAFSGCLGSMLEQSDEGFECGGAARLNWEGWDDHPDNTTNGTDDNLLRVLMDNICSHPDDVLYVFASHTDCESRTCVGIHIEDANGTNTLCSTDAGADCVITEDNPDGVWTHNEWITLTENGVNIWGEGEDGVENIEANYWPYPHYLHVL
jgi:hypothetical protein